ncbi:MAG: hypothetical protein U0175_23335 [Caldilineaceae bacterium]
MSSIFKRLPLRHSVTTKVVNSVLALTFTLSLLPAPLQAAASQEETANKNLFLPLLVSASNQGDNNEIDLGKIVLTPRKLRYTVGKLYQYDYAVQINSTSAKRDAQGVQEDGGETTVIQATANLLITGQAADGSFLGEVSLQSPTLYRTDGKNQYAVDDAETIKALSIPLRFKQAANGVITTVSSPTDASPQVVNIQKGVLNALQVTLVDNQSDYMAQEQAGQGTVQVHYTLQEQSSGLRISKQYNQNSFARLIASGTQDPSMKLQNAVDLVLDRNQGVITSMSYNEQIASGDGAVNPDGSGQYDGVTAWSTVRSSGRLTLLSVSDKAPAVTSAGLNYTTDSLGAAITKGIANQSAIDLSQIDLNSELAQLESEPANPANHARLLALIEADSGDPNDRIDVLMTIAEHLQTNAANDMVASGYIDVLTSVATPQAQEMLAAVLGNSSAYPQLAGAPFSTFVKEHALINLSMLKSPTSAIVGAVSAQLKNLNVGLSETAVTVLGAVSSNLSDEDPGTAQQLADLLIANLSAARQPADVDLYLDAVGNAGSSSALAAIKPYLSATMIDNSGQVHDDLELQSAALVALRKIPGSEAEGLLVQALNDTARPHTLRQMVANVLQERSGLSQTAQNALTQFNFGTLAAPGAYSKSWNKLLGNHDLGVDFPGGMDVASPPAAANLTAYAYQSANGWIFQHSLSIAKGELRSFRRGNNQVFGAYLSIANNLIRRQFELEFPCAVSQSGNLYSGSVQFLDVTFSMPVFAVITLNINFKATGNFTLDWSYGADFCGITKITLNAGITPKTWATASASAYLDIVVARGGATLSATLLQTEIPASASVVMDGGGATPSLSFCIDIKVKTQPLSGYLDVWADIRIPRLGIPPWEWKRIGSARVWTFSSPSASYPLLVQCF